MGRPASSQPASQPAAASSSAASPCSPMPAARTDLHRRTPWRPTAVAFAQTRCRRPGRRPAFRTLSRRRRTGARTHKGGTSTAAGANVLLAKGYRPLATLPSSMRLISIVPLIAETGRGGTQDRRPGSPTATDGDGGNGPPAGRTSSSARRARPRPSAEGAAAQHESAALLCFVTLPPPPPPSLRNPLLPGARPHGSPISPTTSQIDRSVGPAGAHVARPEKDGPDVSDRACSIWRTMRMVPKWVERRSEIRRGPDV